jgi:hypothetical protein
LLEEDGVPVNVGDGFLKSFAPSFLTAYGGESLFVRTISDLFTLALARMLIEHGKLDESEPVALFSDEAALEELRDLMRAEPAIRGPLLQESLGHAPAGAIEQVFEAALGPRTFRPWLAAFEERSFETCRAISTPMS